MWYQIPGDAVETVLTKIHNIQICLDKNQNKKIKNKQTKPPTQNTGEVSNKIK